MANQLTLAVAGSRKTQSIVEQCALLPPNRRALVVTYTQTNQAELRDRLSRLAGDNLEIEVLGWFTFLLRHFAKPFLPFKFPGERILGFDFEGRPHRNATGLARFVDSNGAAYGCELGRLASELIAESSGALLRRLECIYDEIHIDEVQDLSAHDWQIIDSLLGSNLDVKMVGDIRQAVLSTNPRSSKNKKYAYAEAIEWFREREARGTLTIIQSSTTWRCHPAIADFSDTIFDDSWGFPKTTSANNKHSGHDGVFLLSSNHVYEYVETFQPQCLRSTANSGKSFNLDYLNFRISKGMTRERVLIVPTEGIRSFLQYGTMLEPLPASSFYVAVTRASQSVAIVLDDPGNSNLPYWNPRGSV